jgi:hypothetical protein
VITSTAKFKTTFRKKGCPLHFWIIPKILLLLSRQPSRFPSYNSVPSIFALHNKNCRYFRATNMVQQSVSVSHNFVLKPLYPFCTQIYQWGRDIFENFICRDCQKRKPLNSPPEQFVYRISIQFWTYFLCSQDLLFTQLLNNSEYQRRKVN